jgi:hypothetical protein
VVMMVRDLHQMHSLALNVSLLHSMLNGHRSDTTVADASPLRVGCSGDIPWSGIQESGV